MPVERRVVIQNTWGLHVRPASKLAECAARFASRIEILKDGRVVDAKSPISLLTLAAVCGTELLVRADGPDAQHAVDTIAALVDRHFDMDKEPDVQNGDP